jgi:hypothetical protein
LREDPRTRLNLQVQLRLSQSETTSRHNGTFLLKIKNKITGNGINWPASPPYLSLRHIHVLPSEL